MFFLPIRYTRIIHVVERVGVLILFKVGEGYNYKLTLIMVFLNTFYTNFSPTVERVYYILKKVGKLMKIINSS